MDNENRTSGPTILPSVKTLLEPNNIKILPQHRLKLAQTNRIPAVCFYNGTFVPIHAGHLNVLHETKKYIESLGTHELLGAYISPSHSGYAAKKLPPADIIGAGHRLSMIQLAIENLDWVMVDRFEMFQPSKTPLSIIMKEFISRIHSQLPNGPKIDVFWLKGEDALLYMGSSDNILQLGFHNVYILNRGCNETNIVDKDTKLETIRNYHQTKWQSIRDASSFPDRYHLIQAEHMNLSSSNIRKCARHPLVTWEELQSCVQIDHVTTYILNHRLWSTSADSLHTKTLTLSNFPKKISDLTPEILSSMLSVNLNSSIKVISFMFKRIGEGKGWSGRLYQLYQIQYSDSTIDNMPKCLIIKFSSGIWMEHEATIEPEFYLTLGSCISNIEIPKCYYAARSPHSSIESLLILQDLSLNYESLGHKYSLSPSRIYSLIATIASLHAEFFEHPLLQQNIYSWLPPFNSSVQHYQTAYANKMADKKFTDYLESNLSPKAYAYARALVQHIPHIFRALTDEPYTLSHGDFWINNIFIRRNESHRLILFDWQTCCRANGLIDVVFLIRLLGSVRARSLEPKVLQLYHQTLVKYGISKYHFTEICRDYYSLALPFILLVHCSWRVIWEKMYEEILMVLEDIVTHSTKNERIICDCQLLI